MSADDATHHSDLTKFRIDLLAAIAAESHPTPPYGLAIKRWVEAHYDDQEINHGRLYPNLDALVMKGLVEKGSVDDRTNSYALTDAGERVLRDYRDTLTDALRTVGDGDS